MDRKALSGDPFLVPINAASIPELLRRAYHDGYKGRDKAGFVYPQSHWDLSVSSAFERSATAIIVSRIEQKQESGK